MFRKAVHVGLCSLAMLSLTLASSGDIPIVQNSGTSRRLFVDGRPFLVLGAELHNSDSSSLQYMKLVWPKLAALNANTALVPVSWELLEPKEGNFDYNLVDGLLSGAREYHLHLVLLWFGSWKNSGSTYDPVWVKTNLDRFPRVQGERGNNLEILSTFGRETRKADARAFAALMKHLRETDGNMHTVIMVQVENEVGLLGPARDYSPEAQAAWKGPVPQPLLSYLTAHKETLDLGLQRVWGKSGFRNSGTWEQVFGATNASSEIFMAWQYAQYVDAVAAAGKAEYPLPIYVNAWLVQHDGELAGQYPSGGPVSRVHDIWRAASPHLDLFAPDIYLADFRGVCSLYSRPGNPLFIPEASNESAASNALYAIGHGALGFSAFAAEDLKPDDPLAHSFYALGQLAPLILENAQFERVAGVVQQRESSTAVELGGYKLLVDYQNHKEEASVPPAAAVIINTAEDEFMVAGFGVSIQFVDATDQARQVEILTVEDGSFVNGTWRPGRRLNGDETDSGTHIVLPNDGIVIQKIRLFRHR